MNSGILIPVVAIVATFAVPITAIVMDFRRRKLQYEERRAMIERGMTPPPLTDLPFDMSGRRDPAQRRERSLRGGIMSLGLGLGLAVAAYLVGSVLVDTFIPQKLAGPLAIGASVMCFIGLGNLVYYAVSRKPGGGDGAAS